MSDVTIEFAKPTDMPAIWQLYEGVWLETYPNEAAGISVKAIQEYLDWERQGMTERWQSAIEQPGDINNNQRAVFVARASNKLVGIISPKVNNDGTHRLTSLYVAPEARGKGMGSKLIERVLDWHQGNDTYLFVAPYLENAHRLYEKYGFKFIEAPLKFFENSPVSYLTMMRNTDN